MMEAAQGHAGHCGTPGRRALKHDVSTSIWSVLHETSPNTLCSFIQCPDFWLFLDLYLWSLSPASWQREEAFRWEKAWAEGDYRYKDETGFWEKLFFLIKRQIIQVEHMVERVRTWVDVPLWISGLWVFGISISDHQIRAKNITIVYRLNKYYTSIVLLIFKYNKI